MKRWIAPLRILGVASVAIASLLWMALAETHARERGVEAIFPMQAVDPRSLLSGHYVTVSLQEVLPAGETCPETEGISEPMWLALRPQGYRTVLEAVGADRAKLSTLNLPMVRGGFQCEDWDNADGREGAAKPQKLLRLFLGVERFHINQADALRIEALLRTIRDTPAPVSAILSLGDDGRARLKGLLVQGERVMLSW